MLGEADIIFQANNQGTSVKNVDGSNYVLDRELSTILDPPLATANTQADGTDVVFDISQQHYVDLTTATSAGIIDLRRAMVLQEFLKETHAAAQGIQNTTVLTTE